MATVVPFASCYAGAYQSRRDSGGENCLSLLTYRGPRFAPRPRLVYQAPRMTLRQICRMLRVMKQVRNREAAAAAARKQVSASPAPPSPGTRSERRCIPSCLRQKRSIKRIG